MSSNWLNITASFRLRFSSLTQSKTALTLESPPEMRKVSLTMPESHSKRSRLMLSGMTAMESQERILALNAPPRQKLPVEGQTDF